MSEEGSLPKGKPMSECPNDVTVLVHHKNLEPYSSIESKSDWTKSNEETFKEWRNFITASELD